MPNKKYDADILLEPWFLPKGASYSIRALLPDNYWLRMRHYFEDYGCLRCGRRKAMYAANGMCQRCRGLVGSRTLRSMKKRIQKPAVVQKEMTLKLHESRRSKANDLLSTLRQGPRNSRSAHKAHVSKSWRREKIQMPFGVVEVIS